jgi:hypothetical protein
MRTRPLSARAKQGAAHASFVVLLAFACPGARVHAQSAENTAPPAPAFSSGDPDLSRNHPAPEQPAQSTFLIPPAPSKAAPRWALDVHSGFTLSLNNRALCPSGFGCVMRSGGGIGATIERRWPKGLGVFGGYDAWFLDSDSVFELGTQQVLRGGIRYTVPTDVVLHPVIELGMGVMVYGDTFLIATFGVLLQPFVGAELELNETFGMRAGIGMRAFSHTKFRTERDNVLRGQHGAFSEALFLELGLTVM